MPLVWLVFLPAVLYQLFALAAGLERLFRMRYRRHYGEPDFRPAISVLKPVRGLDPNTYEAFASQARQDYPEFELLFGVRDEKDPAVAAIRRLQAEFRHIPIHLILCSTEAPNGKVASLIDLAKHARHPVWVLNDGDIQVTNRYLAEVVAPLADKSIGVVTCPYRAQAHSPATVWEALGIATDFIPSTFVAQALGVREFGFGSTLAFRAADLAAAGGFAAVSDYLADDYQLAKQISQQGKRALLSTYTVETSLGEDSWSGAWRHQLRWARTIRASKGAGYLGLPFTHAGVWALLALSCGAFLPATVLILCRISSALATGWFALRSGIAKKLFWLAPLWDCYAFAVWIASYAGNRVHWRDRLLRIDRYGKIKGFG